MLRQRTVHQNRQSFPQPRPTFQELIFIEVWYGTVPVQATRRSLFTGASREGVPGWWYLATSARRKAAHGE